MDRYPWLDAYLLAMPGAKKDFKAEWGWWRYQVGGRLFAATLRPSEKYDPAYAGHDLLTIKCEPLLAEIYRAQYPEVLPGFYTDKRCWNSVDLGGELPDELVRQMCRDSYRLVFERLAKRVQRELLDGRGES